MLTGIGEDDEQVADNKDYPPNLTLVILNLCYSNEEE